MADICFNFTLIKEILLWSYNWFIEHLPLILSLITALFAGWTIFESKKTREVQVWTDFYKTIMGLEADYYRNYRNWDKSQKKEWDGLFFNTIEAFCFLINHKFLSDGKLGTYFDSAFEDWYDKIFLVNSSEEVIKNSNIYEEFKARISIVKARKK